MAVLKGGKEVPAKAKKTKSDNVADIKEKAAS